MHHVMLEDPDEGSLPDIEYSIPATASLLERRPQTLKHGDTFGLFDQYGDIPARDGSPEGLYHADMRCLSKLQFRIERKRPLLLSSAVQDDNGVLSTDLTNPDIFDGEQLRLPRDTIHIVRSKFLWQGGCYERLRVHNFSPHTHTIELTLLFGTDFADLFEVRGHQRTTRGRRSTVVDAPDSVLFQYAGLDDVTRYTRVTLEPVPTRLNPGSARLLITLSPGERRSVFISVLCREGEIPPVMHRRFAPSFRAARQAMRQSTARAAWVETSNALLNELFCRSMADLYTLMTDTPFGPYPYAGIPWFSTPFGRDGIITAIQFLAIDPDVAKGVLRFLAATQAREHNPAADAEPGKILHETRAGELARLGEVPFRLYYGSVDATPLFVSLAGLHLERTGDLETARALWPHVEAALSWIDTYGDRDGDGFVEYFRATEAGLANQGWKDSYDAVFHADGRLAEGPIALCEVQGYVYAARRHAAEMARLLGHEDRAAALDAQAERLRVQFEAAFWCEEIGTYALALDGAKAPCCVRASNAGHLLFSGIASPERAARVADQLMGSAFFSGWGIRTVAATEARYNPMSYHNGSVWPHDNALIALGFARYGFKEHIKRLFTALFAAGAYMELRRLPELFCGFQRLSNRGPTLYPVACSPQAWASAVPFALLQACIGAEFEHGSGNVRFSHPVLPEIVDQVSIRGLRVGSGHLGVLLRRFGQHVSLNVIERSGAPGVSITL